MINFKTSQKNQIKILLNIRIFLYFWNAWRLELRKTYGNIIFIVEKKKYCNGQGKIRLIILINYFFKKITYISLLNYK